MIHFACSAGHKIKAAERFAGRNARCPACGVEVLVPSPAPAISETGALRILNECHSDECQTVPPSSDDALAKRSPTKECPRCNVTLAAAARICWSCRLDVGPTIDSWKSVVRAAARYVKQRRAS
jgi:hypothetical protein